MRQLVTLVFATLFSLSVNSGFAQSGGFLGKKAYFTLDYNFFPNGQPNGKLEYFISNTFLFGGSYMVGNYSVVGFKCGYSPTGIDISYLRVKNDTVAVGEELKASFLLLEANYTLFSMHGAPVGSYISFLAGVTRFSYKDDFVKTYESLSYRYADIGEIGNTETPTIYDLYMGFEIGKQRILFDRIIFKIGSKISFLPLQVINSLRTEDYFGKTPTFEQTSQNRLARQLLFDITISIGFLSF